MAQAVTGAGLGFRRDLLKTLGQNDLSNIDFFELAPENWIGLGGKFERDLRRFTERFPFVCHGLSLSLGSTDPLDLDLLARIKRFMDDHGIALYTEHLSWCSHKGHLYDLLPIPFNEEAVRWVADRIRTAQSILQRRIAIENASYYFVPPGSDMSEVEFINAVVREADCLLHLDVNNLYVNSENLAYDSHAFLAELNMDKVNYLHVAGHLVEADGWRVDTHGAAVIDPVWSLLNQVYQQSPYPAEHLPTCLERDFNFPAWSELSKELDTIKSMQCGAGNDGGVVTS